MMKKRTLLVILIICLLIIGGIFWLGTRPRMGKIWSEFLKPQICDSSLDIVSIVASGDLKKCECLKDDLQKDECRAKIADPILYARALKEYNTSLCDKISSAGMKEACINTTKAKIAFAEKNSSSDLLFSYLNSNNYDGAIRILESSVKKQPNNINDLVLLARVYAEKGLAEHKEAEFSVKAFSLIEKAKVIDKNNANIYLTEGFVYETKMNLDKAVASYDEAIKLDSENISAYFGRGHIKEVFGDTDGAVKDYNTASDLDKENKFMDIYSSLCRIYLYYGLPDLAVKECSIVVDSNSSSNNARAEAHQILGSVYTNFSKYDQAWTHFKLAEISNPNDVNLPIIIANMFILQGDFVKAEEYSRKAIAMDSQKSIAYEKLAKSLLGQKKYQQTIDNALTALSLVDKDASVLFKYKIAVKERLYAILSEAYAGIGDTANKNKYDNLKDSLYNQQ